MRKSKPLEFDRLWFESFLTVIIAGLLLGAVAMIASCFVNDFSPLEIEEFCRQLRPAMLNGLEPERRERIIYLICIAVFPLVAFAAIRIFYIATESKRAAWLLPCGWIALLLFAVAMSFGIINSSVPDTMFYRLLATGVPLNWLCCFTIALAMYGIWVKNCLNSLAWRRVFWVMISLLPIFQIMMCRIYTTNNLHLNFTHHLEIIAYSISQAAAGRWEHDQYGLYSQLLAPLFQLTGTSVTTISIVMAGLYLAMFLALMHIFSKLVRHPIPIFAAALLFCLSASTCTFLNEGRLDPYFAYHPIRSLFPVFGTLLFVLSPLPPPRWYLLLVGGFAGLGIMWNLDGGVPLFGAWGIWLAAEFIYRRNKASFWNAAWFGIAAIAIIGLVAATLFAIHGHLNPLVTQRSHQIFYFMGYFMLPLPLEWHPWQLAVALLIAGMVIGISGYWRGQPCRFSRNCLFLGVLGVGLFTYYQGRSHDNNLIAVSWVALLLAVMFGDRLLRGHRAGATSLPLTLLIFPLLFAVGMSVVTVSICRERAVAGLSETWDGLINPNPGSPTEVKIRFMLDCAEGKRIVNICGESQGIYYAETGFKAGIADFNRTTLILKSEWERVAAELKEAKSPLFVCVNEQQKTEFPEDIFAAYRVVAATPDNRIYYLEPNDKHPENNSPKP